jgi:hypothetical protein
VSGKSTLKNFKAMLAEAKLPEKSVPICLRGDLVADHEAAERDLEVAQKKPADSLAGNGVGEIVERIEALEAEMREHTYDFRLRALPKPKFRAIVAAHPPRRDEDGSVVEQDRYIMANYDELLPALVRACTVDPELAPEDWRFLEVGDDEETRARLTAEGREDEIREAALNDRQWGDLYDAAWFVNRGEVDVPFSRAASLVKRNSSGE